MTRTIDDELRAKRAEGKPPLALIPRSAMDAVAWGIVAGMKKHGRDDWRKGFPFTERLSSAMRHVTDFLEDEDTDKETGVCHLYLAMTQIAFVVEYMTTHPECDDRYATLRRQEDRDEELRKALEDEM